jgi:hypothetical protein
MIERSKGPKSNIDKNSQCTIGAFRRARRSMAIINALRDLVGKTSYLLMPQCPTIQVLTRVWLRAGGESWGSRDQDQPWRTKGPRFVGDLGRGEAENDFPWAGLL